MAEEQPVTPVPVPPPITIKQETNGIVVVTKFLSWLTALIFVVVVLVSTWDNRTEKDAALNQVDKLTEQLECRAVTNFLVTRASANKQIALAEEVVSLGEFITLYLDVQTGRVTVEDALEQAPALREEIFEGKERLAEAAGALETAVQAADRALETCAGE